MNEHGSPLNNFWPDPTVVDPNLAALNWGVLGEQLVLIVVTAAIVERALSTFFETEWFLKYQTARNRDGKGTGGIKTVIAFFASLLIAWLYQLDIMAVLLSHERTSFLGAIVTAGVVAGGAKGSLKLFRDVMNIKSSARIRYEAEERTNGDGLPPQGS